MMSEFPDDADGHVLARMAADGVDLSQPLMIEFAIYAQSESAAEAIQSAVEGTGYESSIDFDDGEEQDESDPDEVEKFGPSWTVYVEVVMAPEHSELIRIQDELDELARPHAGYADGWGAQITPLDSS